MKNKLIKILFLGTSKFAVPILNFLATSQKLQKAGIKIQLVITNPDAKAGRKLKLTPPPVKSEAQKLNLEIWQPENLKDKKVKLKFEEFKPDLIILAAYGKILPPYLINMAPKGALNIHPSLLPKLRGATPIQTVILKDIKETGVSIILMDEEIDHGPILAQAPYQIKENETYTILEENLSQLSVSLLETTLMDWLEGKITPQVQDDNQATFTKLIKKEHGHINWSKPATEIENQIRAYETWPTSFTSWKSQNTNDKLQTNPKAQIIKITKASVLDEDNDQKPGMVIQTKDKKIGVVTGSGILIPEKIQPAGKKEMKIEDFLRGHKEFIGTVLN